MNKQIILNKQPQGKIKESDFKLIEKNLQKPEHHQVLGKSIYLSMDPALFGRLRDDDNYADRVHVGELMQCYGIAQVLESNHPKFKKGDLFFGNIGMQEKCIAHGDEIRKLNPYLGNVSWNLSVIGLAGVTAYFGLLEIGKPTKGSCVVISAAAGSVGSLVGQIAKIKGCRVVGIAGSDQKTSYLVDELGFDHAINYKETSDLTAALKKACPNGVDIYFDNVAGELSNAVLPVYNNFARIVLCGRMALTHLDSADQDVGMRDTTVLLRKRIRKQGFVVIDYEKRYLEAILWLIKWIKAGKIKVREQISEGIENAPKALLGLLEGENIGKQLLKTGDIEYSNMKGGKFAGKLIMSNMFPKAFLAWMIKVLNK